MRDVSAGIGINNIKPDNEHLNIYPNPADDFLTIDLYNISQDYMSVGIIDCTGKTVFSSTIKAPQRMRINVTGFVPGLYTVKVVSGNTSQTGKFIRK